MSKDRKKRLHPNIVNIRVSNANVGVLENLEAMVEQSNMSKNEYLETIIIGHIKAGKVLNKVAVSV